MLMSYWLHFTGKKNQSSSVRRSSDILSYVSFRSDDQLVGKSWIIQPIWLKIPFEPIIKFILPSLGILNEWFLNVHSGELVWKHYQVTFDSACGQFHGMNRFFHITMYSSFAFSGIVDLMTIYLKLPRFTSQLFQCLAFCNQIILFTYHVHGRNLFNVAIHQLLTLFIYASAIFATLRMLNPRILLFNAGLAGSMILQGTNFIQAGFLIYGGYHYNPLSHDNTKFIAAITTWHVTGVGLFMILVFVITRALFGRLAQSKWKAIIGESSDERYQLIHKDATMELQDLRDENISWRIQVYVTIYDWIWINHPAH